MMWMMFQVVHPEPLEAIERERGSGRPAEVLFQDSTAVDGLCAAIEE